MLQCAAIFTDHMVLLRDNRVCIWGASDNNEKITVSIDGLFVETMAENGKWQVYLPPHQAGGPYTLTVSQGEEYVVLEDVLYGEVFLAAGQSNMEMELSSCSGGAAEIEMAAYREIRFYNTYKTGYIDEMLEEEIRREAWKCCIDGACKSMSAVAYFAAKRIYEELRIPVGIIDCYQGGTSISCWLPTEVLSAYTGGVRYIDEYNALIGDKTEEQYDEEVAEYWKAWHAWDDRVQAVRSENPDASWNEISAYAGECPWPQPAGHKSVFRPSGGYKSMVCRIAPYTVRAVMYYQGETDAAYAKDYYLLMEALIRNWRGLFHNAELPFVITQLPMFIEKDTEDDCSWARLREQQLTVFENIRNTELLVLADCGEYGNIHPLDKKTPGDRLGKLLLEVLFDSQIKGRAMFPKRIYRSGKDLVIIFDNTYGGILVEPVEQRDRHAVKPYAFEVAGSDGNFCPCDYSVRNECIVLHGAGNAMLVRYAWWNYGEVRIWNNAHIPLVPFGARYVQ